MDTFDLAAMIEGCSITICEDVAHNAALLSNRIGHTFRFSGLTLLGNFVFKAQGQTDMILNGLQVLDLYNAGYINDGKNDNLSKEIRELRTIGYR